VHET
jgi:hypothetical protein